MTDPTSRPQDSAARPADAQDAPPRPQDSSTNSPTAPQDAYNAASYPQSPPPKAPVYSSPQAGPLTPDQERSWATLSHVIPAAVFFVSGGTLGFVAALVMYLVFKDRGPFVRAASAASLNLQIITGIVLLVSIPLMFLLVGFVTAAAAWVFAIVIHIIAASKASAGEWYQPPLTPKFVS